MYKKAVLRIKKETISQFREEKKLNKVNLKNNRKEQMTDYMQYSQTTQIIKRYYALHGTNFYLYICITNNMV